MKHLKKIIFISTIIMVTQLSGCCLFKNCGNYARTDISAASYLNPDQTGKAKPVVVTFYQLSQQSAFSQASDTKLLQNPEKVLGGALIDRVETEIQPGSDQEVTILLKPSTSYIGIVSAYRVIGSNKWKAVIPVLKNGKQKTVDINLSLDSRGISVKS